MQGAPLVAGGTERGVYRATTSARADRVSAELISDLQMIVKGGTVLAGGAKRVNVEYQIYNDHIHYLLCAEAAA